MIKTRKLKKYHKKSKHIKRNVNKFTRKSRKKAISNLKRKKSIKRKHNKMKINLKGGGSYDKIMEILTELLTRSSDMSNEKARKHTMTIILTAHRSLIKEHMFELFNNRPATYDEKIKMARKINYYINLLLNDPTIKEYVGFISNDNERLLQSWIDIAESNIDKYKAEKAAKEAEEEEAAKAAKAAEEEEAEEEEAE